MPSEYLELEKRTEAEVRDRKNDFVYETRDGFYCVVAGQTFGGWRSRGEAVAGMHVERRRVDQRQGALNVAP